MECYFSEVSGCTLSPQDVLDSEVSHTGEGFDSYPLKHRRILRLYGLPLKGSCRLCHDEMKLPDSSLFLDGLYRDKDALHITLSNTTDQDIFGELHHTHVFENPIKLMWTAQFLRFLMRPRKWFEQMPQKS